MKNSKRKRAAVETEENSAPEPLPATRNSDEPIPKKKKWVNKQRVLIFASRGVSHRDRHLMEDMRKLMPHHKPESKMERSKTLTVVNEMCEMKNCNKAILFEGRKKMDLYMWIANVPNGPSVKFFVENSHTMSELKMTGNCLRGSRPVLSFDTKFSEHPHYVLLKELFVQTFGVPNHHPKSQPFFDHVFTFSILDNRIWFRNFQVLSEDGALAEVGPRFVLNPVKIFSGSFGGVPLWENPNYISPTRYRLQLRLKAKEKYVNRVQQKAHQVANRNLDSYNVTPLNEVFEGDPLVQAERMEGENEEEVELDNSLKKVMRKPKVKKRGIKKSKKAKQKS